MNYKIFTTPKAGLDDAVNEDATSVRALNDRDLLLVVSDGASTGVFSRLWSQHLAGGVDSAWLEGPETFLAGLTSLRASFQPDLSRPTALRKFLMEGSYATIMALRIRRQPFWFDRLRLRMFAIGDVTVFVFDRFGRMVYSWPQKKREDFDNTPELFRSSAKLQEKSPFTLRTDEAHAPRGGLVAVASDAIGEYLFSIPEVQRLSLLHEVARCPDAAAFRTLADGLRAKGMKNDDVTLCLLTARPDLHFPVERA